LSDLLTSSSTLHALREQKRAAFLLGLRAIAPGLVALTIWGVVTGVAMSRSGLTDQTAARRLGGDYRARCTTLDDTDRPSV